MLASLITSFVNCGQSPLYAGSKRIVPKLFTCSSKQVSDKEPVSLKSSFLLPEIAVSMFYAEMKEAEPLQHQSHWGFKSWTWKLVIYIILLSEIITAMLAYFDGSSIFLLSLRNYHQMEGINRKTNFCIKAAGANCCSEDIYFCGTAESRFDPNGMAVWKHNYRIISSDFQLFSCFVLHQASLFSSCITGTLD